MTTFRRTIAALGAVVLLLSIAAPAGAASPAVITEILVAGSSQLRVGISPPPCEDSSYRFIGGKWNKPYQWSFKASSTPSGLNKSAVASMLRKSFDNVTSARNDCGIADNVSATHEYLGTTTRSPGCNSRDGFNTIGFGRLQWGVLAVTCFWQSPDGTRIVEADMKINSREQWALSLAQCSGDMPMLEATVTHEAGHVFGLDHVGERRHGRLTMSPFIDGPCENGEATLGRGDVQGLQKLY